jgi:hypothetical protein
MTDTEFWLDLEARFKKIRDNDAHPLCAEYCSIGWPLNASPHVPGVIADAPHWRIGGGGIDAARDFEAAACWAVTELGYPSGEWWRWLDILKDHGQTVGPDDPLFDDDPLFIAEPDDAEPTEITTSTIRLLSASARTCMTRAAANRNPSERRHAVIDPILKQKNMTPLDWATRAGVSKSATYDYLRATSTPRGNVADALAQAIGLARLPE